MQRGYASMSLGSLTLRLLTALALAAPVGACEGPRGVAEYAQDSDVTYSIRAKFLEDPAVHLDDVDVITLNGNVRLTGRVSSERERQLAAQIARNVKACAASITRLSCVRSESAARWIARRIAAWRDMGWHRLCIEGAN